MDNTLKDLGVCPKCGKGHIIEHPFGWSCNNSEKQADGTWKGCDFVIFKNNNYVGEMTEDMVLHLLTKGETSEMEMHNKAGRPFHAKLILKDGKVALGFNEHFLEGRCPVCGGRIKKTSKGYACEHFFEEGDSHCNFYVGNFICNRMITEQEVENFVAGRKQVLDGFVSKAGKPFSSLLSLKEDGSVFLNSTICKCPVCGGEIRVSPKAYNCSNFSNEDVKCQFFIWRNLDGHIVTPEDVIQLCENGQVDEVLRFYRENGRPFDKQMKFQDGRIVLV
jgi:rRNA maturation protein Nop10